MKYLSQIEATRFLGYKNHNSIHHLVRHKKLQEYKLGLTGRKYYLKSDCIALLEELEKLRNGRED
jgi:hypothetical protein